MRFAGGRALPRLTMGGFQPRGPGPGSEGDQPTLGREGGVSPEKMLAGGAKLPPRNWGPAGPAFKGGPARRGIGGADGGKAGRPPANIGGGPGGRGCALADPAIKRAAIIIAGTAILAKICRDMILPRR